MINSRPIKRAISLIKLKNESFFSFVEKTAKGINQEKHFGRANKLKKEAIEIMETVSAKQKEIEVLTKAYDEINIELDILLSPTFKEITEKSKLGWSLLKNRKP